MHRWLLAFALVPAACERGRSRTPRTTPSCCFRAHLRADHMRA